MEAKKPNTSSYFKQIQTQKSIQTISNASTPPGSFPKHKKPVRTYPGQRKVKAHGLILGEKRGDSFNNKLRSDEWTI